MTYEETTRNAIRGKRNRDSGEYFEQLISASCRYYDGTGKAYITKTPEPMKPIRQTGSGRFEAFFEKKAQPDFKGTLAGGRAVAFEAKHTETGRMLQSAVNYEQEKQLDRHEQMGALCFVLVSFDFRLFYRVPWDIWRSMKQHYGHKYITPEEAAPYRLRYINGVLDFLREEQQT